MSDYTTAHPNHGHVSDRRHCEECKLPHVAYARGLITLGELIRELQRQDWASDELRAKP